MSEKVAFCTNHPQVVVIQIDEDGPPAFAELSFIFEIIPHKYSIGLMIVGNLVW